jgi:transposase
MKTECTKENVIKVLGIDLAKSSFQLDGVNAAGEVICRQKLSRQQLKEKMVNLPDCIVAMEACGSAHYWGRLFRSYGHEVKLMAPQFVKPYVKSNKTDAADAEAICEAAQRPNMRFVALKEVEQQDLQSLHRIRSQVVGQKTALINQIRGLLQEYGVEIPKGSAKVFEKLPLILEDADNGLSDYFRKLLSGLYTALKDMEQRLKGYDQEIVRMSQQNEEAKRLQTIPGIGPIIATALIAAIGSSIGCFKNGRELAAWLGLVPRQHSTGGRQQLLGISKRGDVYLRQLLIHGARSVLRHIEKKTDGTSQWLKSLQQRRHNNIVAVALANKMARTVFALLKKGEDFKPVDMCTNPA